nr:uncharacterized protein CTRU02_14210 [Colletotrichum truncatum]KAF6782433.1 hypothetical protein CTRU02_14210 [Colletotrichum truncatum]
MAHIRRLLTPNTPVRLADQTAHSDPVWPTASPRSAFCVNDIVASAMEPKPKPRRPKMIDYNHRARQLLRYANADPPLPNRGTITDEHIQRAKYLQPQFQPETDVDYVDEEQWPAEWEKKGGHSLRGFVNCQPWKNETADYLEGERHDESQLDGTQEAAVVTGDDQRSEAREVTGVSTDNTEPLSLRGLADKLPQTTPVSTSPDDRRPWKRQIPPSPRNLSVVSYAAPSPCTAPLTNIAWTPSSFGLTIGNDTWPQFGQTKDTPTPLVIDRPKLADFSFRDDAANGRGDQSRSVSPHDIGRKKFTSQDMDRFRNWHLIRHEASLSTCTTRARSELERKMYLVRPNGKRWSEEFDRILWPRLVAALKARYRKLGEHEVWYVDEDQVVYAAWSKAFLLEEWDGVSFSRAYAERLLRGAEAGIDSPPGDDGDDIDKDGEHNDSEERRPQDDDNETVRPEDSVSNMIPATPAPTPGRRGLAQKAQPTVVLEEADDDDDALEMKGLSFDSIRGLMLCGAANLVDFRWRISCQDHGLVEGDRAARRETETLREQCLEELRLLDAALDRAAAREMGIRDREVASPAMGPIWGQMLGGLWRE